MSGWHRDNPEFCDDIDAMLGVPERPLPGEPVDYDMDQLREDIALLSEAALTPEDVAYERAAWRYGMDGNGAL
jgi:hypothetical protein